MALFHPQMKILIVDDFNTMRRIVKTLMKQLGYDNFVEAENGLSAYETLKAHADTTLVISDLAMPHMTGLDFLKTVRSEEQFRLLPFLLVTSESEKEDIEKAFKIGVSGCIVKPFTALNLKEKLERIEASYSEKTKKVS